MNPEATDPRWRGTYLVAAAGALLTALCIPLQVALFIAWPPPASHSISAWFDLFNATPLLGLLSLDLLMMVEQILVIPIALALGLLVHRASGSAALLGSVLWLTGAVLMVGSNTGFEMLSLARGYAAAEPAAQATYLAAAQGMLASYWDMGTGFVFGYTTTAAGGVLLGAAMVRARLFGRAPGWALVAANVIGLAIFIPVIGIPLSLVSVLVLWAWYLRLGIGLVRLARGARAADPAAAGAAVSPSSDRPAGAGATA